MTIESILIFGPIDVSTLIVSVIVALTTVYATTTIYQHYMLNNSKKGLIVEIARNFTRVNTLLEKVNKIIDKYEEATQNRKIPRLTEIILFEKTAYNYSSQNGFLLSYPQDIILNIEEMYNLLELITHRYYIDVKYHDKLQDHAQTEEQKIQWEKNRLINLQNMQERIVEFQEKYKNLKENLRIFV